MKTPISYLALVMQGIAYLAPNKMAAPALATIAKKGLFLCTALLLAGGNIAHAQEDVPEPNIRVNWDLLDMLDPDGAPQRQDMILPDQQPKSGFNRDIVDDLESLPKRDHPYQPPLETGQPAGAMQAVEAIEPPPLPTLEPAPAPESVNQPTPQPVPQAVPSLAPALDPAPAIEMAEEQPPAEAITPAPPKAQEAEAAQSEAPEAPEANQMLSLPIPDQESAPQTEPEIQPEKQLALAPEYRLIYDAEQQAPTANMVAALGPYIQALQQNADARLVLTSIASDFEADRPDRSQLRRISLARAQALRQALVDAGAARAQIDLNPQGHKRAATPDQPAHFIDVKLTP